jgi:hypothetical protein
VSKSRPQPLRIDLDAEARSIRSRDFAGAIRREMFCGDVEGQSLESEEILARAMAFEPGIGLERGPEREMWVGRPVEVHAYADRIVIRQDGRIVAEHPRSFGRGETVYEPMVMALMNQDGVSIDEARALYFSVGQRLKENARDARPHVIKPPCLTPCTVVAPDQPSQCL